MAIQKTEAVILRRQEIRETSLQLCAYTRHLGKVHGLVKGVRGARAAVPWYLEPLTHQGMILYERRRSPVALISSFDLIDAFDPIRRDLTRTAYASFCLDLVDVMTEPSDPHPEIFELLLSVLQAMAQGAHPASASRFLELHLLRRCGLLPDPSALSVSPGARQTVSQILQSPFDRAGRLVVSGAVENELRLLLRSLLRGAAEREMKSREFLHAIGLEENVGAVS